MSYRTNLKAGQTTLLGEKLMLFKVLKMQSKDLLLIIVPESIRKVLFDNYHDGPSGGHMGEYKIIYRLCLWFFWTSMRKLIRDWVVVGVHCLNYNT